MIKLFFAVVATIILMTGIAKAEDKRAARPTVCEQWEVYSGKSSKVAVCIAGKRPVTFTRYTEVRFTDKEGKPASYILGWR